MDSNYNGIDEFMKWLGYEKIESEESSDNKFSSEDNSTEKNNYNVRGANCSFQIDPTAGESSNCCRFANLDIPGGFQDIDPVTFVTLGEVVGNILSYELPLNVSNSISNLLNFVGQIVETAAAQQSYYQSGPGRMYNLGNRNIQNPFCTSNLNMQNENWDSTSTSASDMQNQIEELKDQLNSLSISINEINEKLNSKDNNINLKGDKKNLNHESQ